MTATAVQPTVPPYWPVALQGGAVAAAAVLGWLVAAREAPWELAVVGYVLGAVVAVFLLTLYRSLSSLRRSKHFLRRPLLDRASLGLAVAGLACGLFCGYLVATELAKW
ncbi:hypothetical protein FE251_06530 [Georgenia wutianyii]|uniref:DUF202 domain-containing protein n=1 Tax=Georgenia wutianyii TaxID=2585135 RepID=A0ABX5VPU5_9MICO|nr:hypothetical protein [Georgenia wutianyii]QDB79064.1 hypothetical protein FE251_06530 [Georgenia wutianyii]